jgi:acetoin utilization protein AcuB
MPNATPTISEFMTRSPHSIRSTATVDEAMRLMRQHGFRHLPVLEEGTLVGIVTERDLFFIASRKAMTGRPVTIEEAMSLDTYVVAPDAALQEVAMDMWRRKLGSAVVMEKGRLVGMFTTVDALRALATQVAIDRHARVAPPRKKPARSPREASPSPEQGGKPCTP